MKPLFIVAEMIGSPDKNNSHLFLQNCFQCDDHYSAVAFGNSRIALLRKNMPFLQVIDICMRYPTWEFFYFSMSYFVE